MIAEYLAGETRRGLGASAVAGARSAIISVVGAATGQPMLARHPLIALSVRAASVAKPARPRYEEAWSPALVRGYWERRKGETLSEQDLRARAISLFLTGAVARPSDAARLVFSLLKVDSTGVTFQVKGSKEDRNDNALTPPRHVLRAPAGQVCVVSALEEYLAAVAAARAGGPDRVFLSLPQGRKPRTALGSDSVSNVADRVFRAAGVPAHFCGGSGRLAAATERLDSGADPLDVLAEGHWTSLRVMNRFYNRSRTRAARLAAARRRGGDGGAAATAATEAVAGPAAPQVNASAAAPGTAGDAAAGGVVPRSRAAAPMAAAGRGTQRDGAPAGAPRRPGRPAGAAPAAGLLLAWLTPADGSKASSHGAQ